jgi:flagellar motor switch protein FliG
MIANTASPTPEAERPVSSTLTGVQKAAMVLVMLGEECSAQLIKQLTEDQVQLVSREIARISSIPADQADAVVEEFYQMTMARDYVVRGGIDYAKGMLHSAFGPETAKKLIDRVVAALGHNMANFEALQKADPQQLARFLQSEHPQTIALVMAHLNPSQAAALLAALPAPVRTDIALRVARLDEISPEIINKIAAVIGQKLSAVGEFSRESYGGVRAVAEIFNRLDTDTGKTILNELEVKEPALVESIRLIMFSFDDLLLLPDEAMKAILARVDRKVPMIALKGTSQRLQDHFLKTMSERGALMMREDMEALGAVKVKDVEVAQQEIIAALRVLESEGVVNLRGSVGEQYVV